MIEQAARRLGVSEVALRMSIDTLDPHPTLEVIVAIVKQHGVDPAWLVSGEYDASTHRAAVDDERALSNAELTRLVASRLTPSTSPAVPVGPGALELPAATSATSAPDPRDQLRLEA